jgi:protein TonB
MFSFNCNEGALQTGDRHLANTFDKNAISRSGRFWAMLLGEERPLDMWLLLSLLVLLLHVWVLTYFMGADEEITQAKPLIMEVSMVAIQAPKQIVAEPPKPVPPPPPPPEKKIPPKKHTPPKPVVRKPPPVVQKAPEFAPVEPEPVKQEASTQNSESATNAASSTTTSKVTTTAPTFTEANFRANYLHNPKPEYPAIARSRNWQGKVLLRVKVSAQGLAVTASVEQSSGHDMLDESAIEAVKKWRFTPAKRGDTPVESSVIVPIDFKLRN